ncbi:hypothetical protein Q7C36_022712 [Tachysurus vachellii]|uniref:Uncharacterized protein n=1 Tax=Tachysurus vachellii TaxID=175792 RepID=A0AA88ILX1_TACVA|nr:hypothetical protein Q7C36_022712 [Tachysurus vachellii]
MSGKTLMSATLKAKGESKDLGSSQDKESMEQGPVTNQRLTLKKHLKNHENKTRGSWRLQSSKSSCICRGTPRRTS